jgi:membrane associated rhomboid family serine protease
MNMFKIPTVTKNLLIINFVAFIAMYFLKSFNLNNVLGLHFIFAPDFHFYQLFTYMFMHANFQHIFFNMFALWMFGCVVENVWGGKKFLFYYFACGIGAGLFQELAQVVQFYFIASEQIQGFTLLEMSTVIANSGDVLNQWTTVGASGAIYGILLAFGMIFPEERIFIFPLPIPIKAKWFVIFYVAVEVVSALSSPGDGVAHLAHLGGMLIGFFMIRYWRKHPGTANRQQGQQFFDGLRSKWERSSHHKAKNSGSKPNTDTWSTSRHQSDWDYNAEQKAKQDEIDNILDKIRRSGYDSLTKEEKQKLFDSSNKK